MLITRKAVLLACCSMLMACGGGDRLEALGLVPPSFVPSPERFAGSGQVAPIPTGEQRYNETVDGVSFAGRNEVTSITYNAVTQTLTIAGDPFDDAGTFSRVPERDVRGFAAFENSAGARNYLALVRTDAEHGLAAGVVGTPVKLDNEFGGTMLARADTPVLPVNREVRHVGDYAGIRNIGANVGADMSGSFLQRVEGRVQLDLDFFADRPTRGIEGVITKRRNMDGVTVREVTVEVPVLGGAAGETTTEVRQVVEEITYDDIVLRFTGIDANGNFTGVAAVGGTALGSFDGMIAGADAAASAGVVVIVEGGELERGAFTARAQE